METCVEPYRWLFLDLNCYFASVEQQENPKLLGKPVAVVPLNSDHTCVIAASREAKLFGIKTGTSLRDAKRLCPMLQCVLARHDIYVQYHHRIIDEVGRHAPINKIWSIDEMSCRLPPRQRTRDAAMAVAHTIKTGLRTALGPAITCSVGIASNSYLGKVASDMKKPDGLVVLDASNMPAALFTLDLTDLPGISHAMARRLYDGGITRIDQFWQISPKQARAVWGSVLGETMWYKLHGHDLPETVTHRSSIGHSRMLDSHLRAPEAAFSVARTLTFKAASRLRREGYFARAFDLSVRTADGQRWAHSHTLVATQDSFAFDAALKTMWQHMLRTLYPDRIKKISVIIHGLIEPTLVTRDLFEEARQKTDHAYKAGTEKRAALTGALDQIAKKFGPNLVSLGTTPRTQAGYVGTKIAFNRIPDAAEFWE